MDPNACVERIYRLVTKENPDFDEANNALEDLSFWLERGGFSPDSEHSGMLVEALRLLLERNRQSHAKEQLIRDTLNGKNK